MIKQSKIQEEFQSSKLPWLHEDPNESNFSPYPSHYALEGKWPSLICTFFY
jgi:hypothetical protein